MSKYFANGSKLREVVVRVNGIPAGASLDWHPRNCASNGLGAPTKDGKPVDGLLRCVAEFRKELDSCSVIANLALTDWVTEQVCDGGGRAVESQGRVFFFGQARETVRGTARVVTHNIMDRDIRLVAVDQQGREHFTGSSMSRSQQLRMIDVEFAVPPHEIREYRFQSRPVDQFEIDGVALEHTPEAAEPRIAR
jgi:hypothetical protein